jgi:hypothetical protein
MCFAILRITFKNDKAVQTIDCDSQTSMKTKISECQAKDQVARIGVFMCSQHIERVEEWKAKPYTPPDEATP